MSELNISLPSMVVQLLGILLFITKQMLQIILNTHAATWRQKLAADYPINSLHISKGPVHVHFHT